MSTFTVNPATFSNGLPTTVYFQASSSVLPSGLAFTCSDGSASITNLNFQSSGYYSATFTAGPSTGSPTISAPGYTPVSVSVGPTSSRGGTNLHTVPTARFGSPNFVYVIGTDDNVADAYPETTYIGHIMRVQPQGGYAGGLYACYASFHGFVNVGGSGSPDNYQYPLQLKPLYGSPDLPEGMTAGVWSVMFGRRGAGLSGTNLIRADNGYSFDPDSPAGAGISSAQVQISGGTNWTAGTYGVQAYAYAGGGDLGFSGNMFQLPGEAGSYGAYGATWAKVGGVTILTPAVHSSFTGAINILLPGDSISQGRTDLGAALAAAYPNAASINVVNVAVSGSTTDGWQPSENQSNQDNLKTWLADAINAGNAAGVTGCSIMLGTNDAHSLSPAMFGANLQHIVNGLRAGIPTLQWIVLQEAPAQSGGDSASTNNVLPQYTAEYASISGATPGLSNAQTNYAIFLAAPQLLLDGIHPTQDGGREIIYTWLESMAPSILAQTSGGPPAPTAGFSVSPTSGTAPLGVTITNAGTGATSYAYDWGDGTAHATTASPTHTYTAAGTYTITQTVTNPGGSNTTTHGVTVNAPVVAVFPPANQVLTGVHYGPAGNNFTGTYVPPVATYAGVADVRVGVDRGDGTLGTLVVPAASAVKAGTAFGAGSVLTGTYTVALPTAGQVLTGVTYGAPQASLIGTYTPLSSPTYASAANVRYGTDRGDGVTGTMRVPTASQVLSGVQVDATSGNVTLPAAGDVRTGTAYGVNGAGTTGTLVVTSGSAGLTTDQAAQLALVATEIVKVPRSGVAHIYTSSNGTATVTLSTP